MVQPREEEEACKRHGSAHARRRVLMAVAIGVGGGGGAGGRRMSSMKNMSTFSHSIVLDCESDKHLRKQGLKKTPLANYHNTYRVYYNVVNQKSLSSKKVLE